MMTTTAVMAHHEDVSHVQGGEHEHEEEVEEDTFEEINNNDNSNRPLFDLSLILNVTNNSATASSNGNTNTRRGRNRSTSNGNNRRNNHNNGDDNISVATTVDMIASSVGSVVMSKREAFLKSFTFYESDNIINSVNADDNDSDICNNNNNNNNNWGIVFGQPIKTKKGLIGSKIRLPIERVDEDSIFALSRICSGDYIKSINGKIIGSSLLLHPDHCLLKMKESLRKDGYLTITTKNCDEGTNDVLVHATIIRPRTKNMSLKDFGVVVWFWGYLCIKSIEDESIFKRTVLKENDNIISINEIDCEKLTSIEQFETIVQTLPSREITITVLRRKQRRNGDFK